jgi:hypothetical protein
MLRLLFTWWHGDVWHGDWAGFEVAGPGLPDALLVFVGTRASAVEALEQQPPGTSWFVLECSQEKVGNDIKFLEQVGGTEVGRGEVRGWGRLLSCELTVGSEPTCPPVYLSTYPFHPLPWAAGARAVPGRLPLSEFQVDLWCPLAGVASAV